MRGGPKGKVPISSPLPCAELRDGQMSEQLAETLCPRGNGKAPPERGWGGDPCEQGPPRVRSQGWGGWRSTSCAPHTQRGTLHRCLALLGFHGLCQVFSDPQAP